MECGVCSSALINNSDAGEILIFTGFKSSCNNQCKEYLLISSINADEYVYVTFLWSTSTQNGHLNLLDVSIFCLYIGFVSQNNLQILDWKLYWNTLFYVMFKSNINLIIFTGMRALPIIWNPLNVFWIKNK